MRYTNLSARGFELFKFWYNLYQSAVEDVLPPYESFSEGSKVQFNTRIKLFRETTGCHKQEVPNVLIYALYHDPYKKGPNYYGSIGKALSTYNKYLSWKRANADLISLYGTDHAILKTAPSVDKKEFEQEVNLDIYLEAYKQIDEE